MSDHNLHKIKANFQAPGSVRRETMDGREHLVVPVVMIVEGVLNNALLTESEFGKYAESWNGRPVPVLHPERNGQPVSANQPDIISKSTIGHIFNTKAEGGKLKAEAWIDINKAGRIGQSDLIAQLEAGEVVEVSTGYWADDEIKAGEHNGRAYETIHRNIRPDHLALLPGQEGACSVADGCGTRVNSKRGIAMKTREAFELIANKLGLKSNCNCEEQEMDLLTQAKALHKNEALTAKQLQMIQDMDEDQLAMLQAIVSAMPGKSAEPPETEEGEKEVEEMAKGEDGENVATNKSAAKTPDVDELVANKVAEHLRRHDVTQKLTANERCPFTADEMKAMEIEHLEKLEKSIRPADYSGQGGPTTHGAGPATNPLRINRGILSQRKEDK